MSIPYDIPSLGQFFGSNRRIEVEAPNELFGAMVVLSRRISQLMSKVMSKRNVVTSFPLAHSSQFSQHQVGSWKLGTAKYERIKTISQLHSRERRLERLECAVLGPHFSKHVRRLHPTVSNSDGVGCD